MKAVSQTMGSTKNGIIGYFIKHAIYITLFGSIIGIVPASIFNRLLFNALVPFIETLREDG
jgi:ABC-type lipoprotein release transport system permease subunit